MAILQDGHHPYYEHRKAA